jgi:hypothetical protein
MPRLIGTGCIYLEPHLPRSEPAYPRLRSVGQDRELPDPGFSDAYDLTMGMRCGVAGDEWTKWDPQGTFL